MIFQLRPLEEHEGDSGWPWELFNCVFERGIGHKTCADACVCCFAYALSLNMSHTHTHVVPLSTAIWLTHLLTNRDSSFTSVRWLLNVKGMSRDTHRRTSQSFSGPWHMASRHDKDMSTRSSQQFIALSLALVLVIYWRSSHWRWTRQPSLAELQCIYIQQYPTDRIKCLVKCGFIPINLSYCWLYLSITISSTSSSLAYPPRTFSSLPVSLLILLLVWKCCCFLSAPTQTQIPSVRLFSHVPLPLATSPLNATAPPRGKVIRGCDAVRGFPPVIFQIVPLIGSLLPLSQ